MLKLVEVSVSKQLKEEGNKKKTWLATISKDLKICNLTEKIESREMIHVVDPI